MDNEFKRFVQDELERITVKIATGADISANFQGTGFFVTPDGYIVTAWHCIKDAFNYKEEIYVECHDGKRFPAQVVKDKSVESLDIAVLKVNCENRKNCIPLGTVSKQHRNHEVISVGFPGIDKIETGIGSFEGQISRLVGSDDIEILNAILGPAKVADLFIITRVIV